MISLSFKSTEKLNSSKFVYGASLGFDKWDFNKADEEITKFILKIELEYQ